jgi:hypothetical protein
MSDSFRISAAYGKLRLVRRSHDMGGTDYEPLMPLTLEQATILGASGCGIHWLFDPSDPLPEVPDGADVVLLPSLERHDSLRLAVCIHDTVLVECPVDPDELVRCGVHVRTRLDMPGRTPDDATRAEAQRLVAKAEAAQQQADAFLEQANALFRSLPDSKG